MKMASDNEGCHIIDKGSKRNIAELPLPEATLPCVAPRATYGEINDVHSWAAFSSIPLREMMLMGIHTGS
ncbi:hypothetical protein Nepgr_015820 [Nepenthes gracilis]|uniref:Uncharacterized protein n=1 Tax=Nepenthes gracilis TaxID=150966 RepID=A0AAD3XRG4_NEPGR|nr:hypothetical protein Nepgr_015820 [Nepenthes gracilis]